MANQAVDRVLRNDIVISVKFFIPRACAVAALTIPAFASAIAANSDGNTTIRATAGPSEIMIKTTERLAGAIDSLTWNGKEFIDSADHGRQLQSASNLNCGTPITAETFNPTEAGSRMDGAGNKSSSELLEIRAAGNELTTSSKMAFWLAPGLKSGANLAKNTTVLSDHGLKKNVKIGYKDMPNVISYDVTFTLPPGEHHTNAVFEALTGYMPPEFEQFLQFNPKSGTLEPLSDGPGEGPNPVVLSVPDGTHAMGIFAPPQPAPDTTGPTYGRFRFAEAKVVKWNCVFRTDNDSGIGPGEHTFRMFVVVGDLETVLSSMSALHSEFQDQ
ncbi:MAG: hypothetical protein D4R65_08355 [Verrucomicrobiaceae bacterium]|nr:MAG: hypothetical protein D4R65_08355 [Verrucomicrobiaceae bacterium]